MKIEQIKNLSLLYRERCYSKVQKCNWILFLMLTLLMGTSLTVSAQESKISIQGTILDRDDREPVIGAYIKEVGTTNAVVTDTDGQFSLQVAPQASIEITSIGYQSQTIKIGTQTVLNIQLTKDDHLLKDVVVVGYGVQKKVNLTAAVSSVDMKDLEGKPVSNVVEALQGTTPGLIIQQPNSQPGSRLSINIRGTNTLNNNDPLIIIDGMVGDIQNVNPSDIENISVLKDASSTAIYGSRASNGVILVTTKKGKEGRTQVTYDFNYSIQTPTAMPKLAKSWEYAELRNEALVNSGRSIQFTPEQIHSLRTNGVTHNWMDEIYRDRAAHQTHNLSVTGGGDRTTYLVSVGYMDQESLLEGPSFGMSRYNGRLNMETKITDRLTIGTTVAYARHKVKDHAYWTDWLIEQSSRMPPIYPIKNEDGSYNLPAGSNWNALQRLEEGGYSSVADDDLSATFTAEYKIIDGLKAKTMIGGQLYNRRFHENRKAMEGTGDTENKLTEQFDRTENLTTNVILTYDKVFNEVHTISALVGYAYEGSKNNGFNTYRITDTSDYDIMVGTQTEKTGNTGWASDESMYSGFMRLNYNFKDRYLFEFNLRDDVSSKFRKGNRSGWFPSLSAAWRVSEESFYSDGIKEIMPSVKLRGSWGKVGNNRIGNYQYMATASTYPGYNFGGNIVNVASFSSVYSDIRWETTTSSNIGIDLGFLNNALTFTADFFNNNTNDILYSPPISGVYGGGSPTINGGKVRNRGWEVSARYKLKTGGVEHVFAGNLSDAQNKVIKFGEQEIHGWDVQTIIKEGYPMYSYYGYRWDGFFQNDAEVAAGPHLQGITPKPGDIRYISKNGDDLIKEDDDRFVLGNPFPRFTYGFNYNMQWKGFDFAMFWQGVGMRSVWIRGESAEAFHNNNEGPVLDFHLDRWTPSNPNANYPRLTVGAESNNNAAKSDFWIQNAAYLRLKNVQLGYTLPNTLYRKFYVENMRIFTSIQNALTFDKMKGGLDPETSGGRVYPVARTFALGLNVKF